MIKNELTIFVPVVCFTAATINNRAELLCPSSPI